MISDTLLDYFEYQAKACDGLGSPFTARLCRLLPTLLDDRTETGRSVKEWPGNFRADALALRLTGGLHALVLAGADDSLKAVYPPYEVSDAGLATALAAAIERHDSFLHDYLDSAPQTNEVARAGMLLPGFLAIARETGRPLAIREIGSSAGLNLVFDRFHYVYGAATWGDANAPVALSPEVRGVDPVPLEGDLRIASRAGSDISPVDIAVEAERNRLLSYVWADQALRFSRIEAAIRLAKEERVDVAKADAAGFVRTELANRRDGEAFVLFHSIMWQYMPQPSKDAIHSALDEAGQGATREAPVARLRMEPLGDAPHATLSLTLWPGGETRRLAKCDYHGRWIKWTGA
ncbi:MAG: DUF2332 family protein [Rhizobiaceae bacterium]|nr:DUF2332 family protein [Rhizobiaceae bacterium]